MEQNEKKYITDDVDKQEQVNGSVKKEGYSCPRCGSDDYEWGDGLLEARCRKCGCAWTYGMPH